MKTKLTPRQEEIIKDYMADGWTREQCLAEFKECFYCGKPEITRPYGEDETPICVCCISEPENIAVCRETWFKLFEKSLGKENLESEKDFGLISSDLPQLLEDGERLGTVALAMCMEQGLVNTVVLSNGRTMVFRVVDSSNKTDFTPLSNSDKYRLVTEEGNS